MYEETALEILDLGLTAHEEAHVDDYFLTSKKCAPSWTQSRKDWAFQFFGVEKFKEAVNFKYWMGTEVSHNQSYFHGFVKFKQHVPGARLFNVCCGLMEITVDANDQFAAAGGKECQDLKILIPLWKARLFQVLFNRKAGAIATINRKQDVLLPALLDLGFKIQSEWMYNPNSGNEIMLLFFQFPR